MMSPARGVVAGLGCLVCLGWAGCGEPAGSSDSVAPPTAAPAGVATAGAAVAPNAAPEAPASVLVAPPARRVSPRPELVPPAAIRDHAPKTDDGLPILAERDAAGVAIAIAYDARLDDPVARWGDCVSLVLGCRRKQAGPIAPCVSQIAVCAEGGVGPACCPAACLEGFARAVKATVSEEGAFDQVILAGDCVPGLTELRNTARAAVEGAGD